MLAHLIGAHAIGDFCLQNDWMQRKSKSSFVCTVHVACYALPFAWLLAKGIAPLWIVVALLTEHWLQDRFGLHLKWMKLYRQTTPDKWPVGPLCMDQAMHIGFMTALTLL
jgi:hypothetical protein